ncbi:MAG: flagellar basal body P-ring formation protein FlgA [Parafilimonas terrae]|nr:flagellar basal body P-ring formation protein FlgA [Parafilimonas terrae]
MTRDARPVRIAARIARALGAAGLPFAFAARLAAGPAAAAEQVLPVPVATIYAGDVIKPTMLRDQAFPESYKPRQPVADTAARVAGRIARRTLLPGETIPAIALEEAKLVTRGAPTVIVFEEHGVTISTLGTALANAAVNEAVSVRNTATGRVVQGIVLQDGRVRTGQP